MVIHRDASDWMGRIGDTDQRHPKLGLALNMFPKSRRACRITRTGSVNLGTAAPGGTGELEPCKVSVRHFPWLRANACPAALSLAAYNCKWTGFKQSAYRMFMHGDVDNREMINLPTV